MSNDIADTKLAHKRACLLRQEPHLIKFVWSCSERLFQKRWGQSKSIAVTSDNERTAPPCGA
ncbi:hypothetical protein PHLCEN_2v9624 [Hermanssonia centrifuga]|uniref:Uncharacterized protein n=1 Tax=Hermanssonia centrifuga TaxID=98765 RepID=A0A2R6NQB7_9APHY|nr:hypothetical protein PHLCEN_2v9624 [Hermanssonia centrifuga]